MHYIVRDDAVHLINSSRGRIAQLQRWPDGLQAAVEAKEGIETTETGEVLDTITVQALINRYPTVCGMTGTALAAGEQLRQFYKLGVSPIPPNTPNIREDETDRVYITAAAKIDAIIAHIIEVHETGQPVLVGTHDVAESEELHERLQRRGVPAVVLNAKNDAEEAAGDRRGRQARRGHGLDPDGRPRHRHPARRLRRSDRPLRKKRWSNWVGCTWSAPAGTTPNGWTTSCAAAPAARATRVRRCSSPAGKTTSRRPTSNPTSCRLQTDEDGRIVSPKVAGLLEHAQRVAEGRLLDVHANTWRYNQLTAQQRAIIVERRNTLLSTAAAREELAELAPERYEELSEELSEEQLEKICRLIMLYHLDRGWADHLAYLADIRESIHLRALGRQNPLDEFHRMAVDAFASLAADAIEAAQQTFETSTGDRGRAGCGPVQAGPSDVDVDLHGARQPVVRRLAFRAEPARHFPLMSAEPRPGPLRHPLVAGLRSRLMDRPPLDRLLTVPNVLSGLRLALIPVFVYLLLVAHADGWAVAILMFSGASDWADGKIARLMNQSSRLGVLLDPRSTGCTW